jgi:hypothetical protein
VDFLIPVDIVNPISVPIRLKGHFFDQLNDLIGLLFMVGNLDGGIHRFNIDGYSLHDS